MEKYQKALDNVKAIEVNSEECLYVCDLCEDDIKTLQESVDKANKYDEKETPMKVDLKTRYPVCDFDGDGDNAYDCPKCESGVISYSPYCPNCGQKLDWGDQ